MKRPAIVFIAILCALFVVAAPNAAAQKKDKSTGRLLFGKVLDAQDSPLPDAVVYLTNSRTRAVKSYIIGADGTYRFLRSPVPSTTRSTLNTKTARVTPSRSANSTTAPRSTSS